MANWCGAFRSNYFKVKSPKKFRLFFDTIKKQYSEIDLWEEEKEFAFGGYCNIPNSLYGKEGNAAIDSITLEIAKYLKDDEILILQEAGNEKLRYVTGYAVAINSKGKTTSIEISDIYDIASKEFKIPKEKISYCE